MAITYEVLALRYGIFDGRLQFQNYIIPDDHAAPDPLDFYVFAICGNGRTIVMDTGFNPALGEAPWPGTVAHASRGTAAGGVDPAEAPDVVLTHMHWDHAGGMKYSRRRHSICRRPRWPTAPARACAQPFLRRPFDVEDVQSALHAVSVMWASISTMKSSASLLAALAAWASTSRVSEWMVIFASSRTAGAEVELSPCEPVMDIPLVASACGTLD